MKYLLDLEPMACLQNVVVQDLRDLGIAVELPKKDPEIFEFKKSKSKEDSLVRKVVVAFRQNLFACYGGVIVYPIGRAMPLQKLQPSNGKNSKMHAS